MPARKKSRRVQRGGLAYSRVPIKNQPGPLPHNPKPPLTVVDGLVFRSSRQGKSVVPGINEKSFLHTFGTPLTPGQKGGGCGCDQSGGYSKGSKSKTRKGRKNFTTKKTSKVYNPRGTYKKKKPAPYKGVRKVSLKVAKKRLTAAKKKLTTAEKKVKKEEKKIKDMKKKLTKAKKNVTNAGKKLKVAKKNAKK